MPPRFWARLRFSQAEPLHFMNAVSTCSRFFKEIGYTLPIFPGGAAVAQSTVNRLVVGSNPTRGADLKRRRKAFFSHTDPRSNVRGTLRVGFERRSGARVSRRGCEAVPRQT